MARFIRSLATVALLVGAFLFAAAPAGAQPNPCPAPYTAYVVHPVSDNLLLALDLNADGTVCVYLDDDLARVVDNSNLAELLGIGLPAGWTVVTGPVTIEDVTITIEDIFDVDQRGNRNNVIGGFVCSQNTGNSCFSNNKILQHVKVIVAEDALNVL